MKASVPIARTAVPVPPVTTMLWVNGQRAGTEGPHISAFDRGFMLADGLFETMRVYDGVIFRLDRHLDRLTGGARILGIPVPAQLRASVEAAVREAKGAGVGNAALRLTITRGAGAPGLAPPDHARPTITLAIRPCPRIAATPPGLSACIASGRRNEHAVTSGLKTLSYTDAILALAEARAAGMDEAIVLDTAGHVAEATASNVFLVQSGALVTPPPACGILPGITRATVMEMARAIGVRVQERPVAEAELSSAAEAFCTSSLREIAPLVRVSHHDIGRGVAGELTRQLTAAFAELVARECAA